MSFDRLLFPSEALLLGDDKYLITVAYDPAAEKSYVVIVDSNLDKIVCEW